MKILLRSLGYLIRGEVLGLRVRWPAARALRLQAKQQRHREQLTRAEDGLRELLARL